LTLYECCALKRLDSAEVYSTPKRRRRSRSKMRQRKAASHRVTESVYATAGGDLE
jgi:hypothetical protein